MALQKQVIDSKGVTSNYHRISSFKLESSKLYVTVASYVSEAQRTIEKEILDSNQAYEDFQVETNRLQAELDEKSRLLATMPPSSDPVRAELEAEVVMLSEQYNARLANEQPEQRQPEDKFYTDKTFEFPFDVEQAISLSSLYDRLLNTETFEDAQIV